MVFFIIHKVAFPVIKAFIVGIVLLLLALKSKISISRNKECVEVTKQYQFCTLDKEECDTKTHVFEGSESSSFDLSTLNPISGQARHQTVRDSGRRCVRMLSMPCSWPERRRIAR